MNNGNKINIAILVVAILIFFNTCGVKKSVKKTVVKDTKYLVENVDSLKTITVTQDELELMLEIISYDISYRMLYDNNLVIRTKERPDDIMNRYVEKKSDLEKSLVEIRNKNGK